MPFSKNFVYLILLGCLIEFLASFIGFTKEVFIAYNIFIISLLIIDYVLTPNKEMIKVKRSCDTMLSMGTDNKITIEILNDSNHPLKIEAIDEIPRSFTYKNELMNFEVNKNSKEESKYFVFPQKRGEFRFGNLHIKYTGIFGICSKTFVYDISENIKVYPNIRDLTKYGINMLKRNSFFEGVKKIKTYHSESEFDSLRDYSEGDDIKKINWNATARMNKFIVNTYEDEKNQQVFIMIDTGRVMNSEINHVKKLDYAVNAAFLLADVITRKGDKAGVVAFDSKVRRFVPPGKGSRHFQLIAEKLYNITENLVTSNYDEVFDYLNTQNSKRSLLCVFTELFDIGEAKDLINALKVKTRKHIPIVITIKNMSLYKIAKGDVENLDDVYTKSTALKMIEEREAIKKLFDISKITCIDIAPDKLSAEVVNRYLSMKSKI